MPYVRYTGPHDEVEVPDLRLIAKRNHTIEVTGDQLEGLIGQDCWEKTTATKSAPKAADEEE